MSDPATTPSTPAATFAAFEAAENAREMGQEPPAPAEPVEADDDDEPEGAEPAPAATEPTPEKPVAAAPQPTPEKPVSKRQQQINELIRKETEATQRSAKLEAELSEIKARLSKPAEPVAAKPDVKADSVIDPKDPEPVEANFDDYSAFVRELARWEIRQERREAAAAKATRDSEQSFAQKRDSWIERREAFRATDPEFDTVVMPFLARVQPNTPLYDVLMDSPVGPQIGKHLANHPEDMTRIGALHPIQQLRELGKLEAKFDTPETTSASASAGPAAKTVTTAPTPPTTLAARSAEPVDRVGAAVARGDFLAFAAEEDRKALAASR